MLFHASFIKLKFVKKENFGVVKLSIHYIGEKNIHIEQSGKIMKLDAKSNENFYLKENQRLGEKGRFIESD